MVPLRDVRGPMLESVGHSDSGPMWVHTTVFGLLSRPGWVTPISPTEVRTGGESRGSLTRNIPKLANWHLSQGDASPNSNDTNLRVLSLVGLTSPGPPADRVIRYGDGCTHRAV